jgi:DNA integrity scanning protein DisA with diadenylate cyclase activity
MSKQKKSSQSFEIKLINNKNSAEVIITFKDQYPLQEDVADIIEAMGYHTYLIQSQRLKGYRVAKAVAVLTWKADSELIKQFKNALKNCRFIKLF